MRRGVMRSLGYQWDCSVNRGSRRTGFNFQGSSQLCHSLAHSENADTQAGSLGNSEAVFPGFGGHSPALVPYLKLHAALTVQQANRSRRASRMLLDIREAFLNNPEKCSLHLLRHPRKVRLDINPQGDPASFTESMCILS